MSLSTRIGAAFLIANCVAAPYGDLWARSPRSRFRTRFSAWVSSDDPFRPLCFLSISEAREDHVARRSYATTPSIVF